MGTTGKTFDVIQQVPKSSHYHPPPHVNNLIAHSLHTLRNYTGQCWFIFRNLYLNHVSATWRTQDKILALHIFELIRHADGNFAPGKTL